VTFDPGKNHYELFGFPVAFDLDGGELARRYRELARRVHPDKFATASDAERRLSMQMTAAANEAYQTLRDPVRRARYLLELRGLAVDSETDTAMDPQFLAEQMELRESLAEVREAAEPRKRLAELDRDAEQRLNRKMDEFRAAYAGGGERLREARDRLREMQFLAKLKREIEDLEEELA
jgi:molecular chaperone HscB